MEITKIPVVTVRLRLAEKWARRQNLNMFGRPIASRWKRDSEIVLGKGVSVECGGFGPSGGSRQHPAIDPQEETTLLIRDVVYSAAVEAMTEDPENVEILTGVEEKKRILEDEALVLERKLSRIRKALERLSVEPHGDFKRNPECQ